MVPQGRDTFRPPMVKAVYVLNGPSQQIMLPLSTGFSNQSSPSSAVSHPSFTIDNAMICISIPLNDALQDIVLALEAALAAISTGTLPVLLLAAGGASVCETKGKIWRRQSKD